MMNHLLERYKWRALMLMTAILMGCANGQVHKLDLMNEGRIEDGLAQLEQAAREHPEDMASRADYLRERDRAVNYLLMLGKHMRDQGRDVEASAYYRRVLAIDPENARARDGVADIEMAKQHAAALAAARTLLDKGDAEGAQARLQAIFIEKPRHAAALALRHEIEERLTRDNLMLVPALKSRFKQPISLQFRDANLKMVFEAISRTSGVNMLLDRDVKNDLKTTIFVKDASVEDTIDLILMQNQLERKALNDSTLFVYPSTPAKIKEHQELVMRTFHFTNADAKQMQTMIKAMLKTKDIYINEKTNSLVMRDTPEAVRMAEKMVAAQDMNDPEVMLEVEVLEVLHSRLTELGIKWPNQIGLSVTETPAASQTTTTAGGAVITTNSPAVPLTVEGLRHINGSSIKVTPLSMILDLKKEVGDSNLLASPRIRVKQHEKAKIMIGDRVPVITNSVTPVSTGTPVVTGSVQYLDVGLKLEVEPDIHMDSEVSIKTFLEVSNIASQITNASSGTIAYQIGTRNVSTVLRLKDGETQVLAGLINNEDRNSSARVPGLGDLPLIGRLFSSHSDNKRKTEIILSITPHIIRNNQPSDADLAEFWAGTDTALRGKPLTLQAVGMVKSGVPSAAVQPPALAGPASIRLLPGVKPVIAPLVLSLQGTTSQAKVGEQIKIAVYAQTGGKVVATPFKVAFDPAALEIVDVSEGDFLKGNNVQTVFSSDLDQAGGQVSVELSQPGQEGVAGRGSLATLTFRVTAANTQAPITLSATAVNAAGDTVPVMLPAPFNAVLLP